MIFPPNRCTSDNDRNCSADKSFGIITRFSATGTLYLSPGLMLGGCEIRRCVVPKSKGIATFVIPPVIENGELLSMNVRHHVYVTITIHGGHN